MAGYERVDDEGGFAVDALPRQVERRSKPSTLRVDLLLHATKYNISKLINNILARRVEIATLSAFLS